MFPLVMSNYEESWFTVHFARPYDLKAGTIGDRLRAVRPTMFLGVPRVWEKIAEKMKAMVAKNPLTVRQYFHTIHAAIQQIETK